MAVFEAFNRLKVCRYGQMLYNVHDTYVGRSLDLYGEYSEGEVDLFRQIIQPGSVVIEVGANIGAHTLFLAQHVGRKGVVLAYEPQRILFQTLCANMALNSVPNAACLHQAVGSVPGIIIVPAIDYRFEYNFGGLALGDFEAGERVRIVTLDSCSLARCDFLKVDVEGMEQAVLEGAVEMIKRLQPILYVENDKPKKDIELARFVDSLGYNMYWHTPLYYNSSNFFGNPDNVFPNVLSRNMLCVPKSIKQVMEGFNRIEVPPLGATTFEIAKRATDKSE